MMKTESHMTVEYRSSSLCHMLVNCAQSKWLQWQVMMTSPQWYWIHCRCRLWPSGWDQKGAISLSTLLPPLRGGAQGSWASSGPILTQSHRSYEQNKENNDCKLAVTNDCGVQRLLVVWSVLETTKMLNIPSLPTMSNITSVHLGLTGWLSEDGHEAVSTTRKPSHWLSTSITSVSDHGENQHEMPNGGCPIKCCPYYSQKYRYYGNPSHPPEAMTWSLVGWDWILHTPASCLEESNKED